MTYRELSEKSRVILRDAGIDEYNSEVRMIIQHCFDISLNELILKYDEEIEASEKLDLFNMCIEKRKNRYPWQYITNSQNFCGYDFYVNEDVLIPRFDTENLIELIRNDYRDKKDDLSVLDLCCGSGCIGIALNKICGFENIDFADISEKALEVTKINISNLVVDKSAMRVILSDMFSLIEPGLYDIIVCNPPYIETEEIKYLMPEVKDYEPYNALDGKNDGLHFYKIIRNEALNYLAPGGRIYMEIGCNQSEDIIKLFHDLGRVEIYKDLSGLDRIVKVSEIV